MDERLNCKESAVSSLCFSVFCFFFFLVCFSSVNVLVKTSMFNI